ncbi:MAG: hypothetical protein IPI43_13355 [Sandaracinaceae bacterium]|nr:hypothetical protein [Sandaracinaceae bacterium]
MHGEEQRGQRGGLGGLQSAAAPGDSDDGTTTCNALVALLPLRRKVSVSGTAPGSMGRTMPTSPSCETTVDRRPRRA